MLHSRLSTYQLIVFSNPSSKVILGSATPSLESIYNVNIGKYKKIVLSERYGAAEMPIINIVDMQKEKLPSNRWIAKESINAIKRALENKEQVLLYINRIYFIISEYIYFTISR